MKPALKQIALRTIEMESQSISGLAQFINDDFEKAINAIAGTKGRLVISGIGKSAVIAQKIVATLNSTGTPAIFMHAADAIHGDIGIVQRDDTVICISKSGDTPEIKVLVPLLKNFGSTLISMVANKESYLAKQSNFILHTPIAQEADPNNLAPTASTTAQMAMGDALAVALLAVRGFTSQDFAQFHPGGALGKQLYLRVRDIYPNHGAPSVSRNTNLKNTILEMTSQRLGAAVVLDEAHYIIGIITDGDLRRMLVKDLDIKLVRAEDVMTPNPLTIDANALAVEAMVLMRQKSITQLVVVNNEQYVGMVHLHDLLKEGIV